MTENPMGMERFVAGLGELAAIHRSLSKVDLDGMAQVVEWIRDPADSDITPEFAIFMEAVTGLSVEDVLGNFERMVAAAKEFKAVMDQERS